MNKASARTRKGRGGALRAHTRCPRCGYDDRIFGTVARLLQLGVANPDCIGTGSLATLPPRSFPAQSSGALDQLARRFDNLKAPNLSRGKIRFHRLKIRLGLDLGQWMRGRGLVVRNRKAIVRGDEQTFVLQPRQWIEEIGFHFVSGWRDARYSG